MIGGPIGKNIVYSSSLSSFSPYSLAHPTCVFPSLVDDMHIISLALDVVLVFLQLKQEFLALRLSMQLMKCVV
jgi:hypothetical protein